MELTTFSDCLARRLRNEETLESSEAIEITESEGKFTLRMKKATLNDSGDYTVKVGNRLGHDTKTVAVNIRCNHLFYDRH